jgi:PTS system nitrogen regulatory IIA component
MNLRKYITPGTIRMALSGETPEEILSEMVGVLCSAGKMESSHTDEAIKALMRRERLMSTGLQDGVAIPHAKINGIDDLIGALGIKREGIEFGALDGKPSTIFVVTLSPKNAPAPHVPFLAEVCKILQHENTRRKLVDAEDPSEVMRVLFE